MYEKIIQPGLWFSGVAIAACRIFVSTVTFTKDLKAVPNAARQ